MVNPDEKKPVNLKDRGDAFISVFFRHISETLLEVRLEYMHPALKKFLQSSPRVKTEGTTFIQSDNGLLIMSEGKNIVDKVYGLNGSARKQLTTLGATKPGVLPHIEKAIVDAFSQLISLFLKEKTTRAVEEVHTPVMVFYPEGAESPKFILTDEMPTVEIGSPTYLSAMNYTTSTT